MRLGAGAAAGTESRASKRCGIRGRGAWREREEEVNISFSAHAEFMC